MINTTDEKVMLESDEPAFMVLGATSYETPGDTPDAAKKTTIFTIRFNEAMADKLNELGNKFYDADNDSKEEDEAYKKLMRFREDICERVCSKRAEFTRIAFKLAVIIWHRVELKGGRRK